MEQEAKLFYLVPAFIHGQENIPGCSSNIGKGIMLLYFMFYFIHLLGFVLLSVLIPVNMKNMLFQLKNHFFQ